LKILTYNILEGGKSRHPALLEVFKQADADVIALQEANDEAFFNNLAQELDMYSLLGRGNQHFHVGLLSRYPLTRAVVYAEQTPFRHAALVAHLATPYGSLAACVVHLHPYYDARSEAKRVAEVQYILHQLDPYMQGLSVVAGDFNAIEPGVNLNLAMWPQRLQELVKWQGGDIGRDTIKTIAEAGYIDCYRSLHPHSSPSAAQAFSKEAGGYTMPAFSPNTRLDYIFASPLLASKLQSCEVFAPPEAEQASDHLPVLGIF
jgi:endonuclease/exonuclease/phosphatase family metal-dependent hydrolase